MTDTQTSTAGLKMLAALIASRTPGLTTAAERLGIHISTDDFAVLLHLASTLRTKHPEAIALFESAEYKPTLVKIGKQFEDVFKTLGHEAELPHWQSPDPEDVAACKLINDMCGNFNDGGWAEAKHQHKLIASEVNEIVELGIVPRNFQEFADGYGDTLFTVIGGAHRGRLPLRDIFREVVKSNLTKFDSTPEDAELTRKKYQDLGVETYTINVAVTADHQRAYRRLLNRELTGDRLYITKVKEATTSAIDGKFYQEGKFLKSHNFVDTVHAAPVAVFPR